MPIGDETPREWAAAGLREVAVRRQAALPADEAGGAAGQTGGGPVQVNQWIGRPCASDSSQTLSPNNNVNLGLRPTQSQINVRQIP
jgi:hypothetical protein